MKGCNHLQHLFDQRPQLRYDLVERGDVLDLLANRGLPGRAVLGQQKLIEEVLDRLTRHLLKPALGHEGLLHQLLVESLILKYTPQIVEVAWPGDALSLLEDRAQLLP